MHLFVLPLPSVCSIRSIHFGPSIVREQTILLRLYLSLCPVRHMSRNVLPVPLNVECQMGGKRKHSFHLHAVLPVHSVSVDLF